jgi:hypothetical protein
MASLQLLARCCWRLACVMCLHRILSMLAWLLGCRGMGWTEGKALGRNGKEEVKAKELVRWVLVELMAQMSAACGQSAPVAAAAASCRCCRRLKRRLPCMSAWLPCLLRCRRPQRLGLGAAPAPEQQQKKYIKPGGQAGRQAGVGSCCWSRPLPPGRCQLGCGLLPCWNPATLPCPSLSAPFPICLAALPAGGSCEKKDLLYAVARGSEC